MTNPFDTSEYPTEAPVSIVTGTFTAWRRELDFESASYAMRYDLVPRAGGTTLTVDGAQNGTYWDFEIASADSAAWTAGEYRLNLILIRSSDSEEAEIESGHVTIFASSSDRRTHAEIMVGKIESVLNGRADHDVESYSIKSRSITRMSVSELTKWRDYYLDEIARTGGSVSQQIAAKSNTIRVRFV